MSDARGDCPNMEFRYDQENNILYTVPDCRVCDSYYLADTADVVVLAGSDAGRDVAGLVVMAAAHHLSQGGGYDAQTDTFLFGRVADDPAMITKNGDFVGYWQPDGDEPDGFWEPVGVEIRQASKHLGALLAVLPKQSRGEL